jgi:hypothetical protein
MPFKQYRIIAIEPCGQIVKITTEVSKGYEIYDWWEQKFKGWVVKLPLKYQP